MRPYGLNFSYKFTDGLKEQEGKHMRIAVSGELIKPHGTRKTGDWELNPI